MIRSLLLIICLIMVCVVMVEVDKSQEPLKVSEPTSIKTLKVEEVGETAFGMAVYKAENNKCYDESGDQVLCP